LEVEEDRLGVFSANLQIAARLNNAKGNRAVYGVTQFMDLTKEEFKKYYQGYTPSLADQNGKLLSLESENSNGTDYPSSFNWVDKGATTPIYNQGQCGACWSFSATETVESYWFLSGKGPLTKLSMQQLVSCDQFDNGCHGGSTGTAFEYIKHFGGLEPFADYPYTSYSGQRGDCRLNASEEIATIKDWYFISKSPHTDEQAMMQAVYTKGPLSICVDSDTWQFYRSGVLSSHCWQSLNHCVQLTGWGTETDGRQYWIVRNEWGVAWGIQGFIWIEYGKNLCGIADAATLVQI